MPKTSLIAVMALTVFALFPLARSGRCSGTPLQPDALPRIERDKESKAATLHIPQAAGRGVWTLYAGPADGSIDFSSPVASGKEPGAFPLSVPAATRSMFCYERDGHRMLLAERHLPMTGGYNFRDLGGLRTTDGKTIRWGRLFRADGLSRLTDADLDYLASIPLKTIVDFRTDYEAGKSPDRVPSSVAHGVHLSMLPGNLDQAKPEERLAGGVGDDFMEEVNRDLVQDPAIVERYKAFLAAVQDEEYLPLLFHCSAGKDRTGYAAALILFSLGVDKETVMRDYMASASFLQSKYAQVVAEYPERAPLFTVKRQYLQAAIRAMEERSGSVEAYLTEVLAVDLEKMRRLFLEKD